MTYNVTKIADELIKTALGEAYYGNALYVALDFPFLTEEHKRCLHRYLHGANLKTDHVMLQNIANIIIEKGKESCVYPIAGGRSKATPISSQMMTMERMISERDDQLAEKHTEIESLRRRLQDGSPVVEGTIQHMAMEIAALKKELEVERMRRERTVEMAQEHVGARSVLTAGLERSALDAIPIAEYYDHRVLWSCDPHEIASGTDLYTEHQLHAAVTDAVAKVLNIVDTELEGYEAPNALRDHIADMVIGAFGLRSNALAQGREHSERPAGAEG